MIRPRLAPRLVFMLLLASACTPLLARSGQDELLGGGTASACPQATASAIVDDGNHGGVQPASTARGKYAKPVAPATKKASSGGGGEGDGGSLPRVRNGKWHSFLPGMFR